MRWTETLRAWLTPYHPRRATPVDERDRLARRQAEIRARLERLRYEAEQPALRYGYRPRDMRDRENG